MNDIDKMTDVEIFKKALPWMLLMSLVGAVSLTVFYYLVCFGVQIAFWIGGGSIG